MTRAAPIDQKLPTTFSIVLSAVWKSPSAATCCEPVIWNPTRSCRRKAQPAL
jgi:hypothetical protein